MTAPINGKKIFGGGRFFGVNNVTTPTPARFVLVQDQSISFKRQTKELFGENSLAADVGVGETSVTGKVTQGANSARVLNDLMFGQSSSTTTTKEADGEPGTVPGSVAYTIQVTNHSTWTVDLGVIDVVSGTVMTRAAGGAEVAGTSYSVAAGVYTFAAGDANKTRKISYLWTDTSGESVPLNNFAMGRIGGFTGVMVFPWTNPSLGVEQDVLTLNNCVASDHTISSKVGDYGKPTFDFMASVDTSDTLGTFSFSQAA